jgi:two-component system sensor histidine kinase VanS
MQRARDLLSDQEYYELFGTLDSGYYFVIRVSVQNMRETLNITNKFYLILLISMTVVMTIMMIIVTRRYTDPILELATISTRMSNLDFDAKYTGKHKDEIGVLGNSMNELSAKLEGTILELKKANIELQKDIEQKIEIDEMRKDFISNVSHELKTPIALIQGYAEGLKDNINDDPESMEFYCDVIIDESDKMNKMVKKLLALTQIEFGNKQVNIERFNLVDVMEGIIKSVQLRAEQENVKIIFENKEPVYVWADEFQIEEVITNYVSNAFNHIDGKRIIEMKIVEKDGIVRMSVFNTGKQIPENELENVWIKFYKVDKARTREYGGNGIGLSIVKAIADSMNKKCGVFNHEDGVEFWFELDGKASEEGLEYDSNN